jgi:hypothetical protein
VPRTLFVGGANSMDKAAERAASVAEVKRLPGVQAYPRAEVARRIFASEWSALADMGGEVSGHCQPQSVVSLAHKLGAPGDKVGESNDGSRLCDRQFRMVGPTVGSSAPPPPSW